MTIDDHPYVPLLFGSSPVHRLDASATVEQTWDQIAHRAVDAEAIGLGRELADEEIVLLDEWHAGTYGVPDERRSRRFACTCTSAGSPR